QLGSRWEKIFSRAATDIVEGFVTRLDRFAKKDLELSLKQLSGGLTINTPKMPGDMRDRIKASIAANVNLIETIPEPYHKNIEGVVMRSIQFGEEGSATLYRELQHQGRVTDKRAKLIATDQTRKLTSAIQVERMQAAGVRRWRWVHSGGGKEPRQLHIELDGQEFSYDKPPPIIDERTGERGYPGQLINCRCTLVPVISFDEADD